MLQLKKPEAIEKRLELGDYVPIHMLGLRRDDDDATASPDMQIHHEELYQRILKQRGEVVQPVQKPRGDLIDVRLRPAAVKKGWIHFSDFAGAENNLVA